MNEIMSQFTFMNHSWGEKSGQLGTIKKDKARLEYKPNYDRQ